MAEVRDILDGIHKAETEFKCGEYWWKREERKQRPAQGNVPTSQEDGMSNGEMVFQARGQHRAQDRTDSTGGENQADDHCRGMLSLRQDNNNQCVAGKDKRACSHEQGHGEYKGLMPYPMYTL